MFMIRAEIRIEHVNEAVNKINCVGPSLNFRGGHGPPDPPPPPPPPPRPPISMKIVGKAVRDAADICGPQVTEIKRVRPVLNAIVTRIKVDKNMYYKVRDVLLSDTISVDAPELALYLPEGNTNYVVCIMYIWMMSTHQNKHLRKS